MKKLVEKVIAHVDGQYSNTVSGNTEFRYYYDKKLESWLYRVEMSVSSYVDNDGVGDEYYFEVHAKHPNFSEAIVSAEKKFENLKIK